MRHLYGAEFRASNMKGKFQQVFNVIEEFLDNNIFDRKVSRQQHISPYISKTTQPSLKFNQNQKKIVKTEKEFVKD